jgi:hypothetical protein
MGAEIKVELEIVNVNVSGRWSFPSEGHEDMRESRYSLFIFLFI